MQKHAKKEIITFWFEELSPKDWWMGGTHVDQLLCERFSTLMDEVARGEHDDWQDTLEGRLALIIVCDQFSRNIFRGEARSFALDEKARSMVKFALSNYRKGFDAELTQAQKLFFYMPLMHSENMKDQDLSLSIFAEMDSESSLKEAQKHYELVKRFGRFPHRNDALGRNSTPEEQAYLQDPNTSHYGVKKTNST